MMEILKLCLTLAIILLPIFLVLYGTQKGEGKPNIIGWGMIAGIAISAIFLYFMNVSEEHKLAVDRKELNQSIAENLFATTEAKQITEQNSTEIKKSVDSLESFVVSVNTRELNRSELDLLRNTLQSSERLANTTYQHVHDKIESLKKKFANEGNVDRVLSADEIDDIKKVVTIAEEQMRSLDENMRHTAKLVLREVNTAKFLGGPLGLQQGAATSRPLPSWRIKKTTVIHPRDAHAVLQSISHDFRDWNSAIQGLIHADLSAIEQAVNAIIKSDIPDTRPKDYYVPNPPTATNSRP